MRKTRKQLQTRRGNLLSKGVLSMREEKELQAIQQRLSKPEKSHAELIEAARNFLAKKKGDRYFSDRLSCV